MIRLTLARSSLGALILFAPLPARADTCDNILTVFNKHAEELYKREAKGGALCVGMGEVIGLFQARRMVAAECGRDAIATEIDKTIEALRQGMPAECK